MLGRFGRDDLAASLPKQPWTFQRCISTYLAILDHLAAEQGGELWVEKTPLHIRHIDTIERYVPSPLFIHIVRDGREVVASIEDRAQTHSEAFGGQDVDYGIRLWNECIQYTKRHQGKPNHRVVHYENLVDHTDSVMSLLFQFLGLQYDPDIKNYRVTDPTQFILPSEDWKENVARPIEKRPSKFHRLFGPERRREIKQALDLSLLNDLTSVTNKPSQTPTESPQ